MEVDPTVKQTLKFLHSSSPDSAEKIRLALDEIIKQRYGSRKMLVNALSKKYLDEESSPPGTVKRRKSDERASSQKSSTATTQNIVATAQSVSLSLGEHSDEENLKEFGDLACVVCGAMVLKAGNRLVECAECHSLYHQECHKPHISDDDANEQEYFWCCSDCKNKLIMTKSIVTTSSPEKSSSSSSSSYEKHYSKNYEHSSTSSKSKSSSSSKVAPSTGNGSKSPFSSLLNSTTPTAISSSGTSKSASSSSITPNINIISADQRLQIMKKKAAKQLESKRKHK